MWLNCQRASLESCWWLWSFWTTAFLLTSLHFEICQSLGKTKPQLKPFHTSVPKLCHTAHLKCFISVICSCGWSLEAREQRRAHHYFFSSIFRNVDDFVALNVTVSGIPVHSQGGDGRVGHLHVTHSTQRHWWRGHSRSEVSKFDPFKVQQAHSRVLPISDWRFPSLAG